MPHPDDLHIPGETMVYGVEEEPAEAGSDDMDDMEPRLVVQPQPRQEIIIVYGCDD